jgi:hypothetical protein
MLRVLAALMLAAVVALVVHAQNPPPAPVATAPSKACTAATAKAAREQRALDAANAQAARDTKAREGCSRAACARYDSAIAAAQKRAMQHEARVTKFTAAQAKSCKAS